MSTAPPPPPPTPPAPTQLRPISAEPAPARRSELEAILDDLDDVLARYVSFPSTEARWATAAWVAHTWVIEAFDSTPRLAALSAEKGSGKTRLLEVIELYVPSAMLTVNVSAAALFRKVADGGVTVLLDEADTYLGFHVAKDHEDLRGLVNAGHRRGAKVLRAAIAGKGVRVEEYDCFAPVALAGIGDLPDTIMDRSVIIAMRRRAPGEEVEAFRVRRAEREAQSLVGRLEEWAGRAVDRLEGVEPEMPPGIVDRPADVWEPLIVIGDAAGDTWSQRVRSAAVLLNGERSQRDPSLGVQLLADIRDAFGDEDRVTTEALIAALTAMEAAPWGDLRGKPIDARGIARRVKKYDITPGDHRFGDTVRKGYLREDFHDAWTRYLPPVALVADVALPGGERQGDPDPDPASPPVALVADVALPGGERQGTETPTVAPTEDEVGGEIQSFSFTGTQSENEKPFVPSSAEGQQGQHRQPGDLCATCNLAPRSSFSADCIDCSTARPTLDLSAF